MPALFKKPRALKLLSIMAIITATVFGTFAVFGGLSGTDTVKLNPAGVSVDSSGAWVEDSTAWALSDRDTTAAYAPAAAVTNVLVTLPAETELKALKVYGSASALISGFLKTPPEAGRSCPACRASVSNRSQRHGTPLTPRVRSACAESGLRSPNPEIPSPGSKKSSSGAPRPAIRPFRSMP